MACGFKSCYLFRVTKVASFPWLTQEKKHIFYIIKHKKPFIFEKYPEIILYSRIKMTNFEPNNNIILENCNLQTLIRNSMSYLRFDKTLMTNLQESLPKEILRSNRSGAYSCTTLVDCNTRKYHGLLVVPVPELDDENHVLLSSLDATVIQHGAEFNLGLHKYNGDNFSAPKATSTYEIWYRMFLINEYR